MRRRAPLAIAIVLVLGGLVLLVTPFSIQMVITLGPERRFDVPCASPLIGAFTSDPPENWVNYSPNEGVLIERSDRLSGGDCAPEAHLRLGAGLVLIGGGAATAVISRRRDRRLVPAVAPDH